MEKNAIFVNVKPILVYFIYGDIIGEQVVAMEEKLKEMYPDRDTDVIHAETERDKYKILNRFNFEEIDSYIGDLWWNEICEEYDGDDDL